MHSRRATATGAACPRLVAIRALAILAGLAGLAPAARANPAPLRWQAPAACPKADDVDARVTRRLAREPSGVAPIDVTVRADAAGFVADIGGGRTLTSASCSELADAVALVVARLVLEAGDAATPATPATDAAPTLIARAEPRAARSELGVGVRISGASGVGAQPYVGIGGEVAVPIHWRALLIEPAAAEWATTTAQPAVNAASVAIALRTTTLRVGWRSPRLPLRAWVAADLGQLRGEGVMVAAARGGAALWAGIGAGVAVAWPIYGTIAVVGTGELIVPVDRASFTLSDGMVVYRPDVAAARVTLGLEVGWP